MFIPVPGSLEKIPEMTNSSDAL